MPERFSDVERAGKTFVDMPYLPFGEGKYTFYSLFFIKPIIPIFIIYFEGPRICIGLRLAILQVKIAIALLLQKYRFELADQHIGKELKINPKGVVRAPIGGINLNVKLR